MIFALLTPHTDTNDSSMKCHVVCRVELSPLSLKHLGSSAHCSEIYRAFLRGNFAGESYKHLLVQAHNIGRCAVPFREAVSLSNHRP